jgi:hypothetical protein
MPLHHNPPCRSPTPATSAASLQNPRHSFVRQAAPAPCPPHSPSHFFQGSALPPPHPPRNKVAYVGGAPPGYARPCKKCSHASGVSPVPITPDGHKTFFVCPIPLLPPVPAVPLPPRLPPSGEQPRRRRPGPYARRHPHASFPLPPAGTDRRRRPGSSCPAPYPGPPPLRGDGPAPSGGAGSHRSADGNNPPCGKRAWFTWRFSIQPHGPPPLWGGGPALGVALGILFLRVLLFPIYPSIY